MPQAIRKAWDKLLAANHKTMIFFTASSKADDAKLKATSLLAGDWLHAIPITAASSQFQIRLLGRLSLGTTATPTHISVFTALHYSTVSPWQV